MRVISAGNEIKLSTPPRLGQCEKSTASEKALHDLDCNHRAESAQRGHLPQFAE
jgi:hypothetical protein